MQKNYLIKQLFGNFLIQVKLIMFSLDILLVFVNIRKRYCRTGWAKN